MDQNGDGQLSVVELKEGLEKVPEISLTSEDVDKAMAVIDTN